MFFPAGLVGIRIRSRSIHLLGGRCRHFHKGFVHKEPKGYRCKIKSRYIYWRWLISCFMWMSKKVWVTRLHINLFNLNGMCHWNTSDILLKSPFKYASDLIWSDPACCITEYKLLAKLFRSPLTLARRSNFSQKKMTTSPLLFFLFLNLPPVALFLSLPKHYTSDCFLNLPN